MCSCDSFHSWLLFPPFKKHPKMAALFWTGWWGTDIFCESELVCTHTICNEGWTVYAFSRQLSMAHWSFSMDPASAVLCNSHHGAPQKASRVPVSVFAYRNLSRALPLSLSFVSKPCFFFSTHQYLHGYGDELEYEPLLSSNLAHVTSQRLSPYPAVKSD